VGPTRELEQAQNPARASRRGSGARSYYSGGLCPQTHGASAPVESRIGVFPAPLFLKAAARAGRLPADLFGWAPRVVPIWPQRLAKADCGDEGEAGCSHILGLCEELHVTLRDLMEIRKHGETCSGDKSV
jgi:hypothetical protein